MLQSPSTRRAMTQGTLTLAAGARKVTADEVVQPFIAEIQEACAALPEASRPKMVAFLANSDPAAVKYAQWTAKTLQRDGMRFELREVEADDLDEAVQKANADTSVHGMR